MITLVEALNYRCLRYIHRPLRPFQVLVGANASGKSTFLDVIAFLGDLVNDGLDSAISARAQQFKDLVWQRQGDRFELAIQVRIPDTLRHRKEKTAYTDIRYEVAIGEQDNEYIILEENVLFAISPDNEHPNTSILFSEAHCEDSILTHDIEESLQILGKNSDGNAVYCTDGYSIQTTVFHIGLRKSAFANLIGDEKRFPVATWFRDFLTTGVQTFMLNSAKLRKMSAPGQGKGFATDGTNLPWVIDDLRVNHPVQFSRWIEHLATALPDIEDITIGVQPDTNSRYLKIRYAGGLEVPSWMVSDGTLRMLALTLPAYIPDYSGVFLIEEPENGIHPRAVETVFQSLSSVYDSQVMLATHSPIVLNMAKLEDVLCFAKTPEGATDIVAGNEHPRLREWQSEVELGSLLASGVLG